MQMSLMALQYKHVSPKKAQPYKFKLSATNTAGGLCFAVFITLDKRKYVHCIHMCVGKEFMVEKEH